MNEIRMLFVIPAGTVEMPPAAETLAVVWKPANIDDRGTVDFHCPRCRGWLMKDLSDEHAARGHEVWCAWCQLRLSTAQIQA